MSSIYDKASLVLIPSGTKTSKVYSQKPTNGDGDFTFSRSTAATRVNASGNIEKETQNLLIRSNTFNTGWSPVSGTFSQGVTDPFGGNTAWSFTAVNTDPYFYQPVSVTGVLCASLWVKGVGSSIGKNGQIRIGSDIKTFTITDEWVRYEHFANMTATFSLGFEIPNPAVAGDVVHIYGAQLEYGLVARDYIETTTTAVEGGITDNVPRLDYTDSSCPALLLEPQRTNLLTHSEHLESSYYGKTRCTIEDNSTTSPEGVINASKMTSTDASESYIQGNVTTTGTKIYWSFFAKKGDLDYCLGLVWSSPNGCRQWFNLSTGAVGGTTTFGTGYSVDSASIEDYGNGWYRCTMIVNCSAGTQGCRVNISSADTTIGSAVNSYGYFYGLQAEDASYATSYSPTYGSAVTRNLDSAETATPRTSLFNQTEGVIYAEWENVSNGNSRLFNLKGGGHQIYIKQFGTSSERIFGVVYNGSGNVFSASTPNNYLTIGDTYKVALRYKDGEYAFYVNGTQIATSTATGLGSMAADKIDLENNDNAGSCKHKQVLYFPATLTNAELADLTTL